MYRIMYRKKERADTRDMVEDDALKHLSVRLLALLERRLGRVFASYETWCRTMSNAHSKPSVRRFADFATQSWTRDGKESLAVRFRDHTPWILQRADRDHAFLGF